jgi:hypothetical protein
MELLITTSINSRTDNINMRTSVNLLTTWIIIESDPPLLVPGTESLPEHSAAFAEYLHVTLLRVLI